MPTPALPVPLPPLPPSNTQITGPIHKEAAMSMDLIANVLIEAGIYPSLFPYFIRNYHLTATLTKDRNVFFTPYHSQPPFRRQPTRPEYRLQELVRLSAAARTGHTGYVTAPQPDSSVAGRHR